MTNVTAKDNALSYQALGHSTPSQYTLSQSGIGRYQAGVSSLNLLLYICCGAVLIFGGIKVLPVYMENMKIQSVIEGVADSFATEGRAPSKTALRQRIAKRFSIESIQAIDAKDVEFEKEGSAWTIDAGYEKRIDVYRNISLVFDFSESNKVQVSAGATAKN